MAISLSRKNMPLTRIFKPRIEFYSSPREKVLKKSWRGEGRFETEARYITIEDCRICDRKGD